MKWLKELLGFGSVVETATKLIDKLAGTDWTDKEKADWVIQFMQATKHQSPSRRFIALIVTFVWALLITTMVVSYILGNSIGSPEVLMIAKDMKMVMADLVKEPFNYIIAFYFVIGTMNSIRK